MLIEVTSDGWLHWNGNRVRAALGRGGVTDRKIEGDGATPRGIFPLRRVLYRADRLDAPATGLPCSVITPDLGWSDDPADPAYNSLVTLPHPARHEILWREDGLYDVVVPLGYNDDPAVAGRGSAIFLHVARPGHGPTDGCVALALPDLLAVLSLCGGESRMMIL